MTKPSEDVDKPLTLKQQKQAEIAARRRARAAAVQRAYELFDRGWKNVRIAEEIGYSQHTVGNWLKASGRRQRQGHWGIEPEEDPEYAERYGGTEPQCDVLDARDKEAQDIIEVAESQASPADQYQAFVAAQAIRMMRDSLHHVRGPRTVRELDQLDQIIRRSLGLNAKGNSAGALTIDISILNNTKASRNPSIKNKTVDAEVVSED